MPGYTTYLDPKTGKVVTKRNRARSFKRFNEDIAEVMQKNSLSYESLFDLLSVISEKNVNFYCVIGQTGARSYHCDLADGSYGMSSISLPRAILMFVQKTVPMAGFWEERQIKRIKAIIRINTIKKQKQIQDMKVKYVEALEE